MSSFSKFRDMYRLQKEAKRIRKELDAIHVEAESQGVSVVVSAQQEVLEVRIAPDVPHEKIAERLKDALNRALKKAQVVASEKMQGVMGQMGLGTAA